MTTNCWRSVDAYFNVLSSQHLRSSTIVFIMIQTDWLSFCQIETRPCGKAERSNILSLFTLTWLKIIYLAKRFIAPTVHLFSNRYSQSTAYCSPIIYLWLPLSFKQHAKAGELLMYSVRLFLHSFTPPHFCCIDYYQHYFNLCGQIASPYV